MGTSMHLHVEKRVGDKWVYVHAPNKPPQVATREIPPSDWYNDAGHQSYDTMALLANVRNEGIKPIASWRGLPTDASAEVKAAFDWCMEGGANWVTLAEIKAYDYTREATRAVKLFPAEERAGCKTEPFLDIQSVRWFEMHHAEGYVLQSLPVGQLVEDFLDTFLPTVETACMTEPENIRLIMWFDC